MKKLSMTIVIILLCTFTVFAQEEVDKTKPDPPTFVLKINKITKWLENEGFQIRRSFDGTKSETKPAAIAWNSDYENEKFYTVIDAGIKLIDFELLPNSKIIWIAYPKTEWHRNTIDDVTKTKNNLSGGLGTELLYNGGHWYSRPVITGSFDYKKDFVKNLKTIQYNIFASLQGYNVGEPGGQVKTGDDELIFRYYPYTGFEQYRSLGESGQKASIWANRLYIEFFPISNKAYQYVQLTVDYTYRKVFSDNLYNNGNMKWLMLGLNFFPSGKTNLGLGLDYSQGEDPTSNFVKTKLLALGIKLKI
ncbi:hypothetical protein [Pedobacter sp. KBW01]|uniref:hypothetical protein n=1 Tax=Pedobacter sp. KBW01 TaxID=2153364 RepID=UPI000F5AE541|nr:hypothetical protein [Pedobacter sp. KBW01]